MRPNRMRWLAGLVAISAGTFAIGANALGQGESIHLKVAPDVASLISETAGRSPETVRVIIRSRAGEREFRETLKGVGGRVTKSLAVIDSYAAEVPRGSLASLAQDSETMFVSLDRETWLLGDRYDYNLVRATTGAENVVGRDALGLPPLRGDALADYTRSLRSGPNGSGVTIAVLDSGVYDRGQLHEDFGEAYDACSSRVLAHVDFVSDGRGLDPYGHGTHVAGIAAGTGRESLQARTGNFYPGMAFNADLVDLRVIDSTGRGRISDTIAAIDWMVRNRSAYHIRVANLSFGAAVTQSFRTDPLCQAVERAVRAGIVCVCAAGNYGKDSAGNPVYGSILAPANDPMVITVGATNTWGSAERSDDSIASYSSRGPTLVDRIDKPDLVAPATLIRSAASPGNYLSSNNDLTVQESNGECVYMWLSGTSVAAPVVSGTVALMLDANPGLTPSMVKSILQFTAQPLASTESMNPLLRMLTEGSGSLNADAAVTLAGVFRRDACERSAGSRLLAEDGDALQILYASRDPRTGDFISNIAGERIAWGNNLLYSQGIAYLNDGQLRVYKASGWQVTSRSSLTDAYLKLEGRIVPGGQVMDQGRLLTFGATLDQGVVLDQRILSANAWLLTANNASLSNTSAAQNLWASNLMDQTVLAAGTVLDQSVGEGVLVLGETARGNDAPRIESETHPLYPQLKRIKR
ncbi:MAG TPA: S8 family peptidase [Blastocatellia bacterium]|nr:S8 family peptidase [Blastocatellia bacterium]